MFQRASRSLPILLLTLALSAVSLSACIVRPYGRGGVALSVAIPPPALRHEVVVARPGPDLVWVGGYWDWAPARRDWAWVEGRWARPPRHGAVWMAPRYERRNRGWVYIGGYWR